MGRFIKHYLFEKRNKNSIIVVALLSLISILSALPLPYFIKYILDDVLVKKDLAIFRNVIVGVAVLLIIQVSMGYACSYMAAKLVQTIIAQIRTDIYNTQFSQNKLSNEVEIGENQILLLNDAEIIGTNTLDIFWKIFMNVILAISYMGILFFINIRLALLTVLAFPMIFFFIHKISRKLGYYNLSIQETKDQFANELYKNFFSSITIKFFRYTEKRNLAIYNNILKLKTFVTKQEALNTFIQIVLSTITSIIPLVSLFIGCLFVINNQMSIGLLITFYTYQGLVFQPIISLLSISPIYQNMKGSIERVRPILLKKEERESIYSKNKTFYGLHDTYLKLEDIYFERPNHRFSLHIKNIHINHGDKVLVRGENGSGKTTLLEILASINRPIQGAIYLEQEEISSLSIEDLEEQQVIFLPSKPAIFAGDIYENIILDAKQFDHSMFTYLCEKLHFQEVQKRYHFQDKETFNFSDGEKQKISLVRAMIRKPKLLILDEPFSNLDIKTMTFLEEYFQKLPEMTVIFTSHSFQEIALKISNKYIQIKDGEIWMKEET